MLIHVEPLWDGSLRMRAIASPRSTVYLMILIPRRIKEAALQLFAEKGYEGTTLDEIAAASDIARRTFFYYFESKDEILTALQGSGFIEALRPCLIKQPRELRPLDAVRNCLVGLVARHETKEAIVVDRLLRSTETLRARKQAVFVEMERIVFETLCEMWPQRKLRASLQIAADGFDWRYADCHGELEER